MESIKQNSKALPLQAFTPLMHSPPNPCVTVGKPSGTVRLFALAFVGYLICAFMITQNGYLDAPSITLQARNSEFGLILDAEKNGIHPNLLTSVIWLLSLLTGLPASILLYALPAIAGASLAAWMHGRLTRHRSFPGRALCCFMIFASPDALVQFTTASTEAIKVLLMTAAVSVVVALFKDRQPRHYLTFGALLATLIVVEPGTYFALMLLVPPYLLCGAFIRNRNEWIVHLGLALFPLLSSLAALAYLDWILLRYLTPIWLVSPRAYAGATHDAPLGLSGISLILGLVTTGRRFMQQCSTRGVECVWGAIGCSYLILFLMLTLSQPPGNPHYLSELQAYGFGIAIAAVAHAPLHRARRRCVLSLCLFVACVLGWGWEQGSQMTKNQQWRHAFNISFWSAFDTLVNVLPNPVSISFATTMPDKNSADGPAHSVVPTASPVRPGAEKIQEYFARYGVKVDRFNPPDVISAPRTRP